MNVLSLAQSELVDIFVDAYVLYLKRFRHLPDVAAMERRSPDEPSSDALSGSAPASSSAMPDKGPASPSATGNNLTVPPAQSVHGDRI